MLCEHECSYRLDRLFVIFVFSVKGLTTDSSLSGARVLSSWIKVDRSSRSIDQWVDWFHGNTEWNGIDLSCNF